MNELLERLYTELRHYGPNDTFNKGFYLTLTERVLKELGVGDNQCVKPPAYIGQKVWVPFAWYNIPRKEVISELREGKISMLQQKADKSWKLRVTHQYVSDYKVEDINSKVFFTKEAGEEALNKMIKDLETKYGLSDT